MPELLTAKDVELRIFRKASFGGYAIPDVEEFLNQVAEDLEAYAVRLNDQQRRIFELEEALKKHEAMKDTIKDALILAQKSARDKEDEARRQAELIVARAESKMGEINVEARRRLDEAESAADEIVATARVEAARIIKSAEETKDDLQKRIDSIESDIARRMTEASERASEITATARIEAAQIVKSAEETKEDAQRRLENIESEIARRMADANERASEITTTARIEARRATGKIKHEVEESRRELGVSQMARLRFLEESAELTTAFERMVEEARQKLEKAISNLDALEGARPPEKASLSFYPVSENEEEKEVSASL
ncbi:MAG: DivIVA domain-containing protein [Synergistaceae bacterium]|jgi:DivIVA domain-containing protein|nr:DivIVA domain-containing protein [Synergistaceae bacterium]